MTRTHPHSAEDRNAALPRALAGRMISILFILSGLVSIVSMFVPFPGEMVRNTSGVLTVGLIGIGIGIIAWFLPWQRWHRNTMLWFLPLSFVLISLYNFYSGTDPYRYSLFYLVAFTWLGVAQPRGAGFLFIPLFIVSYVAPLWYVNRTAEALSVLYVLPVCLFISESLAWVSERLWRVQTTLFQSEARFRSLAQNASDMVFITGSDSTIRYLSPSVERILGYPTTVLLHTRLTNLLHPDDLSHTQATLERSLQQPNSAISIECRIRHADGSWRYIETTSTNLLNDASVQGIVLNSRDITERKILEDQLTHQAFHDPLTGLANRAAFSNRVEHALTRVERTGTTLAVLFLDLDNFKAINDTFGHTAGDQLLVAVADRLRGCLRASDVAARLGGDEFAILLEDVTITANVVQVADRLLEALHEPFLLDGESIEIGVSIGIAWSHQGRSAADMLRHADIAMYSVKHSGKGRYAIFNPDVHLGQRREELLADL